MANFQNVTVTKPSRDCEIGVSFQVQRGKLTISRIAPDGLFADTGLKVGMEVLGINEAKNSSDLPPEAAERLLQEDDSTVTIRAKLPTAEETRTVTPTAVRAIHRPPPPGCPKGGSWYV